MQLFELDVLDAHIDGHGGCRIVSVKGSVAGQRAVEKVSPQADPRMAKGLWVLLRRDRPTGVRGRRHPDPSSTHGNQAMELDGWNYPRHLAGRSFSVIVHREAAAK